MKKLLAIIFSFISGVFPYSFIAVTIYFQICASGGLSKWQHYSYNLGWQITWIVVSICFILLGCAFMSKITSVSESFGLLSIGGKTYSVNSFGAGRVSVHEGNSGDGGAAFVLAFFVVVITAPFKIIIWIITSIICLFNSDFAESTWDNSIEKIKSLPYLLALGCLIISMLIVLPAYVPATKYEKKYGQAELVMSVESFEYTSERWKSAYIQKFYSFVINIYDSTNELEALDGNYYVVYNGQKYDAVMNRKVQYDSNNKKLYLNDMQFVANGQYLENLEDILSSVVFMFEIRSLNYKHAKYEYELSNDRLISINTESQAKSTNTTPSNNVPSQDNSSELETMYQNALLLYSEGEYRSALAVFNKIKDYKDSGQYISNCQTILNNSKSYLYAMELCNNGQYEEARDIFLALGNFNDASEMVNYCQYKMFAQAMLLYDNGNYDEAISVFESLDGFNDSLTMISNCQYQKNDLIYNQAITYYNDEMFLSAYNDFVKIPNHRDSSTYILLCSQECLLIAESYIDGFRFNDAYNILIAIGYDSVNQEYMNVINTAVNGKYTDLVNYKNWTTITIPNDLTTLPERAFENATIIKSINLPSGLVKISRYCFYGCRGLESVAIPNSVICIDSSAFEDCSNLSSLEIHKGLEIIMPNSFGGCTKLTTIHFDGTKNEWISVTKQNWLRGVKTGKDPSVYCSDYYYDRLSMQWKSY